MFDITALCKAAKKASYGICAADSKQKNTALSEIASAISKRRAEIIFENEKDLENAKKSGMSESMIDRLSLTDKRIDGIIEGILQVTELPDPSGRILSEEVRPNGLKITKISVPIGVIGIIYESRPNVTADAAALCIKSGNAVILKGGKEAINSNRILCKIMRDAVSKAGLSEDTVCFVDSVSREDTAALMKMKDYVDLLIPRGGAGLIRATVENSLIPVIETGTGNCHIYVDEHADEKKALDIIFNAKTSRVSVCNAAESLLIHESRLGLLDKIKERLDQKSVSLYCSSACFNALSSKEKVFLATEEDYYTEYLDYKMSVKEVSSLSDAIAHINEHSSHHSECIVTENEEAAALFLKGVDSAAVYHNASTRFTDGFEFGLGAEIGISTQKMHARGPMGLSELNTYKFVIKGNGQIR
ncbi:MAG: glutamate-5-semialdehyde dehydrogenase [Clostridia bacterium]|nr:glutamate-5-semialdehyde dehydrogenase [Clostridia bacterium]